ncbi:predicted protein [Coccidioides posadasii str. Silveira]|uniref:Predicted protein n=1 Tax=Coccidioides posadasii (strain RMSCC 757 / Silveira) TaxID=443226 RepID=E9D3V1_COCPS|nr:predicted protein [Coccidioides posadasii str. Silveira]
MEELCGNKGAVQTECNEMITEGCLYILLSRTSLADGRAGLSIIPFVLDEFLCRWLRDRCINHIHAERNIPASMIGPFLFSDCRPELRLISRAPEARAEELGCLFKGRVLGW